MHVPKYHLTRTNQDFKKHLDVQKVNDIFWNWKNGWMQWKASSNMEHIWNESKSITGNMINCEHFQWIFLSQHEIKSNILLCYSKIKLCFNEIIFQLKTIQLIRSYFFQWLLFNRKTDTTKLFQISAENCFKVNIQINTRKFAELRLV